MSFISRVELKYQLQSMGIKVENGYIKKSDLEKIVDKKQILADATDIKILNFFKKKGFETRIGSRGWPSIFLKVKEKSPQIEKLGGKKFGPLHLRDEEYENHTYEISIIHDAKPTESDLENIVKLIQSIKYEKYIEPSKTKTKKAKPETPKVIKDYVNGLMGAVNTDDKSVQEYRQWVSNQLDKRLTLYRGFVWGDDIEHYPPFHKKDQIGLSFSENKSVALRFAKEAVESNRGDDTLKGYVIMIDVPPEAILFHHALDPEVSDWKEKEVIVDTAYIGNYLIVKKYKVPSE